jgi:hypothetical protein
MTTDVDYKRIVEVEGGCLAVDAARVLDSFTLGCCPTMLQLTTLAATLSIFLDFITEEDREQINRDWPGYKKLLAEMRSG